MVYYDKVSFSHPYDVFACEMHCKDMLQMGNIQAHMLEHSYLYSKDVTCRHIGTDVYIYTWYRPRTCGRRFVCLFLYAFSGCVWLCVSTRTMDIKQKDYLCAMSHVLHTSPGGTYTSKNSRKLLSFLGKDGDWQNYSIFGGNVSSLRIFLG